LVARIISVLITNVAHCFQVHLVFDAFETKEGEEHKDPTSMKAEYTPMINTQEVDQVNKAANFLENQNAQFPASSCNGSHACGSVSGTIGVNSCNGVRACTYLAGEFV
jgi:hypothetical protein